MSDDVERILRDAPGRFPTPATDVSERVERSVLYQRRRRRGAGYSTFALVLATIFGVVIGRFVLPPDEPAIGAPTAPAVTIDVQPKVTRAFSSIHLTGAIVVKQRGERVVVEANPCGRGWRYLKAVETDERGAWTASPTSLTATDHVLAEMRTTYRAVWRGARSSAVTVAVRAPVRLEYAGQGQRTLEAQVYSAVSMWGKKVTFQRLVDGRWRAHRAVRLADANGIFVAKLRHRLPRGTVVRAALPLAEARPCFVGGFSNGLTL